jgi:hypothetical protein
MDDAATTTVTSVQKRLRMSGDWQQKQETKLFQLTQQCVMQLHLLRKDKYAD